jgi:hypothetical protein
MSLIIETGRHVLIFVDISLAVEIHDSDGHIGVLMQAQPHLQSQVLRPANVVCFDIVNNWKSDREHDERCECSWK